jgi:hypothetical protein
MKIKFLADIEITFWKSADDEEEELIKKNTEMNVSDLGITSSFSGALKFHQFQRGNGDLLAIPEESFVIVEP